MPDRKYIAYFRVSTAKQGRSGLGLEGQRAAVQQYLNGGDWNLLAEFTEVESGKRADRPELARAMEACRLTGATLVIAKLDRLSRSVAFLANLMEAKVDFVCCDNPHATKFTIHILAAVAEHEREAIAKRTKDALEAAKRRGRVLGGYRGGPKPDSRLGVVGKRSKADAFAARVVSTIVKMQWQDLSLRKIATELTARSILTPGGGTWTATAVKRILARSAATEIN
jgi:DNA invertase Pin-like site-specific DNA recombinase